MILARADTPAGEIAVRRRDGILELVVNGVFAMDSAEVSSEQALADAAGRNPGKVLVGGLGLGYTAARLLDAGAERVRVVELAEPLLEWARAGLTEQLHSVASDPRVELVAGDIAEQVNSQWVDSQWVDSQWDANSQQVDSQQVDSQWDAILLDVDNGPGFLIHDHNARVYTRDFLRACLRALAPGGRLVIWCEAESPALASTLDQIAGNVELISVPVTRQGHIFDYALYRAYAEGQP